MLPQTALTLLRFIERQFLSITSDSKKGLLFNNMSYMLVQVWARIYVLTRGSIRTSLMLEEDVVELLRLPARYIDQQVVL
jgi:hypothetical protein